MVASSSAASAASSTTLSSSSLLTELNGLKAELAALLTQAGQESGSSPAVFFSRNLSYGMKGNDVTTLQNFLNTQASGPAATKLKAQGTTKTFGILTFNALKEFQKKAGIVPASGFFGPKTRLYVNAAER
jgi:murein L,D-transpeptidase YcbB/YkuD